MLCFPSGGKPAQPAACQAARTAQEPLAPVTALLTDNTIGYGPTDANKACNFQLQPVHTIKGDNANFILRGVIPYQRNPLSGGGFRDALGDIILQGFYVPNGQEGFKIGFGRQLSLKTRSDPALAGLGNDGTTPLGLTFGKTRALNGGYALDTSV